MHGRLHYIAKYKVHTVVYENLWTMIIFQKGWDKGQTTKTNSSQLLEVYLYIQSPLLFHVSIHFQCILRMF